MGRLAFYQISSRFWSGVLSEKCLKTVKVDKVVDCVGIFDSMEMDFLQR